MRHIRHLNFEEIKDMYSKPRVPHETIGMKKSRLKVLDKLMEHEEMLRQLGEMMDEYKKEKLKHKRKVKRLSNKMTVGVIAQNIEDFNLWWKNLWFGVEGQYKNNTRRKFKKKGQTYHYIGDVCDLCSMSFDEIIETENAKNNKHYDEIISVSKGNIKSNDRTSKDEDYEWVCNECDFSNFTSSVSEEEINSEIHACVNCGGFEFHKRMITIK